jgi:hypothetical protein
MKYRAAFRSSPFAATSSSYHRMAVAGSAAPIALCANVMRARLA